MFYYTLQAFTFAKSFKIFTMAKNVSNVNNFTKLIVAHLFIRLRSKFMSYLAILFKLIDINMYMHINMRKCLQLLKYLKKIC